MNVVRATCEDRSEQHRISRQTGRETVYEAPGFRVKGYLGAKILCATLFGQAPFLGVHNVRKGDQKRGRKKHSKDQTCLSRQ